MCDIQYHQLQVCTYRLTNIQFQRLISDQNLFKFNILLCKDKPRLPTHLLYMTIFRHGTLIGHILPMVSEMTILLGLSSNGEDVTHFLTNYSLPLNEYIYDTFKF